MDLIVYMSLVVVYSFPDIPYHSLSFHLALLINETHNDIIMPAGGNYHTFLTRAFWLCYETKCYLYCILI